MSVNDIYEKYESQDPDDWSGGHSDYVEFGPTGGHGGYSAYGDSRDWGDNV